MTPPVAARGASVRTEAPTLVIRPPDGRSDHDGVPPGAPILGLPLVRRTVLAADRAGFGRIVVLAHDPAAVRPLLEATPALVVPAADGLPPLPPGRIIVLAPDVLALPSWLGALGRMPLAPGAVERDGGAVAVLEADAGSDATTLLSRARRDGAGADGGGPEAPGMLRLWGSRDIPRAEAWLLRGLIKEHESAMSRHLERRISLAVTRRLVGTRVSPNAMTAVSLVLGLLGAPFFLASAAAYQLAGALLLWLHSVLDGCDGELARLRFQESRGGGLFDFWGDNVVHVAVFLCMGAGWALAAGAVWPLLAGAAAAAGTLGAAAAVARHIMPGNPAGAPLFTSVAPARASRLSRLLDALGRRDFIYAVILCAALGKAHWFLVPAALGAPIFFALLLWNVHADARRLERCA